MTAKKFNERSWWRRLARRMRGAEPRTNRLSHFEPLEPRMVLSAGIWMDGGDLWHGSQHAIDHLGGNPGHGNGVAEYSVGIDKQLFAGPPLVSAGSEEIEYRETVFAPHDMGNGPVLGAPQYNPSSGIVAAEDYNIETAEGEYTPLTATLVSPAAPTLSMPTGPIAPANFAWYLSLTAAPTYEVEVVIAPDHSSHDYSYSADSASSSPAVATRPIAITPSYGGTTDIGFMSLMAALSRRVENPPPPSEDHHVPGPVSEDLVPGGTKSTMSSPAAHESGSLLAVLSTSNVARLTDFVHVAANDDDGSVSQRPLAANADSPAQDDENGESAELVTDEVIAAKRKLAASGESRAMVQTQLDGLVDLPVVRVTESLFRELLALYDNASQAQAQAAATTTGMPDDGMVELLAADVSSLASRRIALPVSQEQHGTTLESNVALYQSLEIAGLEDIASAAVQAQSAPVVPAEQLARIE